VDGNDLIAVYIATEQARTMCVEKGTPVLLELMTYRVGDHTTSDDSSAYRRENKEEVDVYKARGPIPRWRAYLTSQGAWDDSKEEAAKAAAKKEIMDAFKEGEKKKRPPLKEMFTDVYTDLPWNLEEHHAYVEKHVREYSGDYNIAKFRDLEGPAPPVDPRRVASTPAKLPPPAGPTQQQTMVVAINDALSIALASEKRTVLFGEDVAFGGVFRCSVGLRDRFGPERVLNAPVAEQAIAGFAVGLSVAGYRAIAEMQFADYIFPAFDQIVNEIAKYRYRNAVGGAGNITFRAPCSAVGHGSMYHSQSVESYFAHCPGLKIVIPRGPRQAKGLLLASIRDPNPVLFFEPKVLYRKPFEGPDGQVPTADYELPLGQADTVRAGEDITLVGWGSQICRLEEAADRAAKEGISCEIIDLQTIIPWDVDTVEASVKKTGRLLVAHEAPVTNGFGAEITAKIQERCFLHLEAPIQRVCGFDTHFPYAWEEFYVPSAARVLDAIKTSMSY
jgi:2-oxoisovalerate dehydrogenase E1 component beta subunit